MKILIAEDDHSSRLLLKTTLQRWKFEVVATSDGDDAWNALQDNDAPAIAILDWMMPGLDGIDICRRVRESQRLEGMYIVLLTAKANKTDIVEGLEAGADDYIVKPFNREELKARINVGIRISKLQEIVKKRVQELEDALSKVKQLQGLLPICSYCKKIRDDKNYWQQVEGYIVKHTDARFSHSVCPECYKEHIEPQLKRLKKEKEDRIRISNASS